MSSSTQRPVHTHEILDRTALWQFRDSARIGLDLERYCVANSAIDFRRTGAELSFCILVSRGCSHLAAIEASPSANTIKVTVYGLNNGFEQKWSITHTGNQAAGAPQRGGWYDTAKMHGGITEDGESVLVVYKPVGREVEVYTVKADGFTRRGPPSDTNVTYSMTSGMVSDDSEHIFYSRRGSGFGKRGESKIVEAYSIRNLARVRAVTFAFGDGHHLRNTGLIRPLRIQGPLYIGIDTSSFGGDDNSRNSPPVIASSERKIHWNFHGIKYIDSTGGPNTFISPNGKYLFYVESDEAMLHHWDLTKPSLEPLGSMRLPGVEYGQSRRWQIYGKETIVRDAIAKQIHHVRYSPKHKLITVVTSNNSTVVVNILLTFNLQLVYHRKIHHSTWNGYVPLRIGFNDQTGLNIVAVSPTLSYNSPGRQTQIVGAMGVVLPLRDIFDNIRKAEDYFDNATEGVTSLMASLGGGQVEPLCRFSWTPGALDRNNSVAIVHELGRLPITNSEDSRRQQEFYDDIFANPQSSMSMTSTLELRHFFVPHLFSFTHPWDPLQSTSLFGVVMKNEFYIITIGPSPSGQGPQISRVLYATDIRVRGDAKQRIEIYKIDSNYILHVSQDGRGIGGYSGAPMPVPRCTIISPHFLEEDAWYDTFVIHRAAHVTMPTNWTQTPNPALTWTTTFRAYFEPNTFVIQDTIDYGHRACSAYVLPKYLLWEEYGLRGLRDSKPNDIFFGGGRYADTLGPYFRSIYDDRTYDDAHPLFPSTFALACNADHRSRGTKHVDAFFRRLHQDDERLLINSSAVSSTLPLACRARPIAALSFMQHIVLFNHKINDIGAVEVKNGTTKSKETNYNSRSYQVYRFFGDLWTTFSPFCNDSDEADSEPNTSHVTLPLPGFCSFTNKLYNPPPVSGHGDPFWDFVQATTPYDEDNFPRWEARLLHWVAYTGKGPASPFTRLVEEILSMKDRNVQLSFLRVAWLEKLLAWKMRTFGLHIYLTRTAFPMLLLFVIHLTVSILLTEDVTSGTITVPIYMLSSMEALVSVYILSIKLRQLFRIPRPFVRSIFNYIDGIALSLGLTLFFFVISHQAPPRSFLAFSTLLIWIATILMMRVYRPVGLLLLLLTETMQGVFSYLILLFFIILGFAFVPFLLLRNITSESNAFSTFPLTFSQMLNFISSDYGALEPFESKFVAVKTLRALYIIVITILFLNTLIALLNLKINAADKNASNLFHLQMASLQVEIELGLLSSSERKGRDWFPEWFSYSMTETEKRLWNEYVDRNPLKWSDENNFSEDKEHVPYIPETTSRQAGSNNTTATASSTTKKQEQTSSTMRNDNTEASSNSEPQVSTAESQKPPLIIHDGKPAADLLSALGPIDETDFPLDDNPEPGGDESDFSDAEDDISSTMSKSASSRQAMSNCCVVCQQPGSLCTGCRMVAYCGKAHQRQHWKTHKSECKPSEEVVAGPSVEMAEFSCVVCGKPGKLCTGCRTVAYCSKEHQKQDWKNHKTACKGKGRA
ncbi:hypothetical protein F5884DRAFT_803753 [Xylogone sp. PMI_703]|nr:hypothetical protein F5884DRAFT_803753 [Xylogone sp. PMI_703]